MSARVARMGGLPPAARDHAGLLIESYRSLSGQPLCPGETIEALWALELPVVSHGTEADPIFRFANAAALDLWQVSWETFTAMPSRLSAEPDPAIQGDRSRYLAQAMAGGMVRDYQGIRISATGRRFRILDTHLWTVTDRDGQRHGQAARIGRTELP